MVYFQIVFQYMGNSETHTALTAVDDISFTVTCAHDPANSELPDTPEPTTTPTSPTSTAPSASPTVNPCKVSAF